MVNAMPMQYICTKLLEDEHQQPIHIHKDRKGFWWSFAHLQNAEKNGPFRSEIKAWEAANEYANELAP